jgi:hypothetical protein
MSLRLLALSNSCPCQCVQRVRNRLFSRFQSDVPCMLPRVVVVILLVAVVVVLLLLIWSWML